MKLSDRQKKEWRNIFDSSELLTAENIEKLVGRTIVKRANSAAAPPIVEPANSAPPPHEQLAILTAIFLQDSIDTNTPIPKDKFDRLIVIKNYLDDKIGKMGLENGTVTSYHCRYYLAQLDRYIAHNANVEISIPGVQKSSVGKPYLDVTQLQSVFLENRATKITVTKFWEKNLFTDVNIYSAEVVGSSHPEQHYSKKLTSKGEPHQEKAQYCFCNQCIGKATQQANIAAKLFSDPDRYNEYFKNVDDEAHKKSLSALKEFFEKLAAGDSIPNALVKDFESYYGDCLLQFKQNSANENQTKTDEKNNSRDEHFFVAHSCIKSKILDKTDGVPLHFVIDPVLEQDLGDAFTYDELIKLKDKVSKPGAAALYERKTRAGLMSNEFSGVDIVAISHNHSDHLSMKSIEMFSKNPNTLFVVPGGDKKKFTNCKNVVELASWNDAYTYIKTGPNGKTSEYIIRALPAKHASGRQMLTADDFYESLYTGFLIENVEKKEVTLYTGDTAVLSDEHFDQISQYVCKGYQLKTTAIAHGPDRPRKYMEISHQSTADAIAMHGRFVVMNYNSWKKNTIGNTNDHKVMVDVLKANAPTAIAKHQGCYRLGVLSLSDVPSTVTHMLAVLDNLKDKKISDILGSAEMRYIGSDLRFQFRDEVWKEYQESHPGEPPIGIDELQERVSEKVRSYLKGKKYDILNNCVFYHFLDDFEKEGLLDLMSTYGKLSLDITLGDIQSIIETKLIVPHPGENTDLSQPGSNKYFKFDYLKMISNRNPEDINADNPPAFEYFVRGTMTVSGVGWDNIDNIKAFLVSACEAYLTYHTEKSGQIVRYGDRELALGHFLNTLDNCSDNQAVCKSLIALSTSCFSPSDESARDESHFHTMITICAGIVNNSTGFREQFAKAQQSVTKKVEKNTDAEQLIKQLQKAAKTFGGLPQNTSTQKKKDTSPSNVDINLLTYGYHYSHEKNHFEFNIPHADLPVIIDFEYFKKNYRSYTVRLGKRYAADGIHDFNQLLRHARNNPNSDLTQYFNVELFISLTNTLKKSTAIGVSVIDGYLKIAKKLGFLNNKFWMDRLWPKTLAKPANLNEKAWGVLKKAVESGTLDEANAMSVLEQYAKRHGIENFTDAICVNTATKTIRVFSDADNKLMISVKDVKDVKDGHLEEISLVKGVLSQQAVLDQAIGLAKDGLPINEKNLQVNPNFKKILGLNEAGSTKLYAKQDLYVKPLTPDSTPDEKIAHYKAISANLLQEYTMRKSCRMDFLSCFGGRHSAGEKHGALSNINLEKIDLDKLPDAAKNGRLYACLKGLADAQQAKITESEKKPENPEIPRLE